MPKTQDESDLSKPEEMFAWMFAAGIPDPRGSDKFPNQPLIPAPCFGALSKMLYDMGCRFHPELQTLWVKEAQGPLRNMQARGYTDVKPVAAAMLIDQASSDPAFQKVAQRIATATPETAQQVLQEQTGELLKSIERLRAAQEAHENSKGG